MKKLYSVLILFLSLNCFGQDKPVAISEKMFDPMTDAVGLGHLDGWYFRMGSDTAWANADVNMAGWKKLSPLDLSAKYAGKNGKLECWFRIKLKLAEALKQKGFTIRYDSYAPVDLFINGKRVGSAGNTGLYGHAYSEYHYDVLSPGILINVKSGEQITLALHLVDSLAPLPPRQLKSQLRPGIDIIYLAGSDSPDLFTEGYLGRIKGFTIWLTVCLSLSLLFWLLVIQNRSQKVFLYIALWTTAAALCVFFGLLQMDVKLPSSLLYLIYEAFNTFTFVFMLVAIPVILAEVFKRRLLRWLKIVLTIIFIYFMFISFLPLAGVLVRVLMLFLIGLSVYYIISSWKTLRGAQWSVVVGLLSVFVFLLSLMILGALFPGKIYADRGIGYYLIAGFALSFPLSLLVFVALRFNEMLREVKQNADEVVRLSEEKKEEALNRQKLLEEEVNRQTAEIRANQARLIQSEKMASLGELTAGIAHEIQNPLNFVNNFSEVSVELLAELKDEEEKGNKEDVIAIADDLTQNLEKIRHHGKRADAIVKGMLQHSQSGSGTKEPTNINELADNYMRLAYQGQLSKDKSFIAEFISNFDEKPPKVNVIPQDIGRVMLNLFNNAFYAVNQRSKAATADYKPEVLVTTSTENGQAVIKVKDNGIGISDAIKEKIMQPFFTTKPTGEGTGLGLSLSYDIVVKGHGGSIDVDTKEGEYTEFTVVLPLS